METERSKNDTEKAAGKATAKKAASGKAGTRSSGGSKGSKGTAGAKKGTRKAAAGKKTALAPSDLKDPLVFGLDIGTRSIVGTVGYKKSTDRFVVVAQVSREHETRSMLDGQIHDINAVAETIRQVKEELEALLDRKLTDVCIAAAGRVLKTVVTEAKVEFNYETVITSEHIYSLDMLGIEKAYELLRQEKHSDELQFYCVGYSVIRYYQNDYPISNLEGHKANSIRTELIATFLPDEVVDGLYAAVEKAGLFVANLTLEPIAAINVAIPERFRLLNIALVDVGAGTSDISITNDGSILAYGMIPAAGDEVTECIARHYLTDFAEAEKIKCQSTTRKQVSYHDIMGLSHRVSAEEVAQITEETVRSITRQVADRIIALNGDKPVSAVFLVGGGGKARGFASSLAEYLGIQEERVAIRGAEVLGGVQFLQEGIKVDSLLVTPIGICLNYYEQRNNFIFVTVNGERIKLYDNSRLSVVDAALQVGFPNDELFPKRGKSLNYYVNGKKRMQRGNAGEAAIVKVNGRETGLNDGIVQNDKIEIIPSTQGKDAELEVGQIPEYRSTMSFTFNGKPVLCPRFVRVNGELVSEFYNIQEGDRIEILAYYTLEQVLEFMDIIYRGRIYVNNAAAQMDTRVYDNFSVACEIKKEEPNYQQLMEEYGDGQVPEAIRNGEIMPEDMELESVFDTEEPVPEDQEEAGEEHSEAEDSQEWEEDEPISPGEAKPSPVAEPAVDISVQVNGEEVILRNKPKYILVDVLDFYPFDLAVAGGDRLETRINGIDSDFTAPVKAGDVITIQWVSNG